MTFQMFEKFSISDIDSAGRGGEYTVQAGFGWTNGVVLILASEFGHVLTAPQCPNLLATAASEGNSGTTQQTTSGASARSSSAFATVAIVGLSALALLF